MRVRAHSQLFLVFDVHALKEVKDFITYHDAVSILHQSWHAIKSAIAE